MSQVAIVDYGSGNLHSVQRAFEHVANQQKNPARIVVTCDPDCIDGSDRVVLPGVGSFSACRKGLERIDGLIEALHHFVHHRAKPLMGICVGMQLLATQGHEFETCQGLGWIPGHVRRLSGDGQVKIPHMGWNDVRFSSTDFQHMFDQFPSPCDMYFVHSYHFIPESSFHCLAHTFHGKKIAAVVGRDNVIGTQFHPEKSQKMGQLFIDRFLSWMV